MCLCTNEQNSLKNSIIRFKINSLVLIKMKFKMTAYCITETLDF